MPLDSIPTVDQLLAEPLFVLALAFVIILAYHYVKRMPYSEFVFLTAVKNRVFLLLDPLARQRGLRLVTTKEYRDDDEYVATLSYSSRVIAKRLFQVGFDQHLIAGSKRRTTPNGTQWAHSHYAYQHSDGTQTEVWLFSNGDGSTDIYAHNEESVFDPDGHLQTPYTPGDPRGVLDGIVP